jgi:GTPase involved in cell partitioning and DNA repair
MGFSKMMELLQQKNKGKIVFCNTGNFYIAIGKDAVLLNNLIDLKLSCLKQEICKVGFPINALEKYTELIAEKEYSYIVYFFNQEKEELEIIMQYEGKNNNEIKENRINCYTCAHCTNAYKKIDKYISAAAKLYEKENKLKEKIQQENKKIWFKIKQKKTN